MATRAIHHSAAEPVERPRHRAREVAAVLLFGMATGGGRLRGVRIPRRIFTMGGGGYSVDDRGLLIGGGGLGGGGTLPAGAGEVRYGAGVGTSEVGVVSEETSYGPLRLYPLFGVGGAGAGASAYKRPVRELIRAKRPIRPDRSTAAGALHFLIGLGLELRLGGRSGVLVGLRAGYRIVPSQVGNRKRGGGPFVQLMLGVFHHVRG